MTGLSVWWGMEYGFSGLKISSERKSRDDLLVREVSIWGDYDLVIQIISHIVYRSNVFDRITFMYIRINVQHDLYQQVLISFCASLFEAPLGS